MEIADLGTRLTRLRFVPAIRTIDREEAQLVLLPATTGDPTIH